MMTDPVADMLTRIRNAVRIERPVVDMPSSRLKVGVAEVFKKEGYIHEYQVGRTARDEMGHEVFQQLSDGESAPKPVLRVFLKYGPQGERVIQNLKRVSRPGCRVYRGQSDLVPVLDGLGVAVLSTSQGVMSDRQARGKNIGGEILCHVW